jgi:hypothetical protein
VLSARLGPAKMFPFLVGGRQEPLVRLKALHHRRLDAAAPEAAGLEVARRVQAVLSGSDLPEG